MIYRQKIFFISLLLVICTNRSAGQLPNTLPKNEFGLIVINNSSDYFTSINNDSLKKMVAVNKYLTNTSTNFVYATANNFTHKVLYKNPKTYLRLAATKALEGVANELQKQKLGILLFDTYRPYSVTKTMWKIVPDDRYAANPAKGSGHNRGIAIDLTLINLQTGKPLQMPTNFDDFTEKAHHNYMRLDSTVLTNRQLLKITMEKHGFIALDTEWWHYYLPNAAKYELLDFDFKQMKKLVK